MDVPFALPDTASRALVLGRAVVATSQPLAAQAGLDVLRAGGNAIDAALAAAITLTVVEPTGCGLGSDLFALVAPAGGVPIALDGSGRSPRAWTRERFGEGVMPASGWESVTVPGAVAAWSDLHERAGRAPFASLFDAAIRYAEDGYPVSPHVARLWSRAAARWPREEFPAFHDTFLSGGRAPVSGEIVRLPDHAVSLRAIAATRGETFYRGDLAARIVADAAAHGAALDAADLADHRSEEVTPLTTTVGAYDVLELPPATQGIAALVALGILERLDPPGNPDDPDAMHLTIEATKVALAILERDVADRAFLGAPPEAWLTSAYLDELASGVDRERATDPILPPPPTGGTVYIAAADAEGTLASVIQSNFRGFGSGVVVPGTGIALQNRGEGFVTQRGHPNGVAGGKRPFHTIIPGLVLRDEAAEMAFGVMGGPMQAPGHVQLIRRVLGGGQDPQSAIDAPRWRPLDGRRVAIEPNFDPALAQELERRGHELEVRPVLEFGGAQAIWTIRDDAGVRHVGASDPRKDGQVVAN